MKVKLYHPDHWLGFPVFSYSLTILWRRLVPGKEYRGFPGVHFGYLRESRHFVLPSVSDTCIPKQITSSVDEWGPEP